MQTVGPLFFAVHWQHLTKGAAACFVYNMLPTKRELATTSTGAPREASSLLSGNGLLLLCTFYSILQAYGSLQILVVLLLACHGSLYPHLAG